MTNSVFKSKVSFNFNATNELHSSAYWYHHFKKNIKIQRVNWLQVPQITLKEQAIVLKSIQAWQLGETSDGKNLLRASQKYADKINDPHYVEAVKVFIKEEQKHGNNLGTYLDMIGQPRIKTDWGDSLFRKVRYFNTSMDCLLYTSPSPRDATLSRMPSSA